MSLDSLQSRIAMNTACQHLFRCEKAVKEARTFLQQATEWVIEAERNSVKRYNQDYRTTIQKITTRLNLFSSELELVEQSFQSEVFQVMLERAKKDKLGGTSGRENDE